MKYFRQIKVFEPATDAIDRTKKILFRDFDVAIWFTIGFSAWLTGFGGFNFGINELVEILNNMRNFSTEMLIDKIKTTDPNEIIIATGIVAIAIAITVFGVWISSRGKFMLMHCVAKNVAEIKRPWKEYKLRANSLFRFKLAIGFIATILLTAIIAAFWLISSLKDSLSYPEDDSAYAIYATGILVASTLTLTPLILTVFFTDAFVLPIMYKHNLRCSDGWRYFLSLFKFNKWKFVKFCFGMLVIRIIIYLAIIALTLATCCLFAFLMSLPYIGAVAMLPVTIFYRSYSAIYLAQYGEELNALEPIPDTEETEPTA